MQTAKSQFNYRIAGNFRGRKLPRIGEKYNFHREKPSRIAIPKDATPSNFMEKTFVNSYKTAKNSQKFSPSKVSRNVVCKEMILYATFTYIGKFVTIMLGSCP